MFYRPLFVAFSLLFVSSSIMACLDNAALNTLAEREMRFMTQRIPPAFADAVADGLVHGQMTLAQSEPCEARWQLNLPANDIAEAEALLQAQPAKQIMLVAQGYQIPQQTMLEAVLKVDAKTIQPSAKEGLQTAPLGKLRASVELMYAMLTQARADLQGVTLTPWREVELEALNQRCQQQFSAANLAQACACRSQHLSQQYSARQVSYNQYLASNPYAFASGNGAHFKQLDKKVQLSCGLNPLSPSP